MHNEAYLQNRRFDIAGDSVSDDTNERPCALDEVGLECRRVGENGNFADGIGRIFSHLWVAVHDSVQKDGHEGLE